MVPWSHRAVLVVAAGACLTLSACGGSPTTPSSAGSPGQAPPGAAGHPVSHFCTELTSAMNDAPAAPPSGKVSAAAARRDLAKILRARVSGLRALEASAPPGLRAAVAKVADVYKAEEKVVTQPGSIASISKSLVQAAGSGSGGPAFRSLLAYVTKNCR
jgi:hypothetical protein